MDSPRRTVRPEPDAAPEQQLYHEPALTGHVSQLDNSRQQLQTASPSEPLSNHPFNLDFPTLNIDGSVPDITAHQTRRYPPTPPAALSSLGAKSKMDRAENMSESEGSFADTQYDMIDDLSEISTDDHETASITSNGDAGQLTPDEAGSDVDVEESTLLLMESDSEDEQPTPPSTTASYVQAERLTSPRCFSSHLHQRVKAENELIDSYMSEDMETPRQSTMPNPLTNSWFRPKNHGVNVTSTSQSASSKDDDLKPRGILFVSEHDVVQFEMDQICSKVAANMSPENATDAVPNKVMRLPAPPSGIGLPSATAVYSGDSISATLQHCVGAELRSPDTYKLRVMDFDAEHSSFHTVGRDAKIDLIKPDVVVFYVVNSEPEGHYSAWLDSAFDAIRILHLPVVVVLDPYLDTQAKRSWVKRCKSAKKHAQVHMSINELLCSDAGPLFENAFHRPLKASQTKKTGLKKTRTSDISWLKLVLMFLVALIPYLLMPYIRSSSNPVLDTAVRREGLSLALEKPSISLGNGAANIEHLIPEPEPDCVPKGLLGRARSDGVCEKHVRAQGIAPNHIIVSLPVAPRLSQVSWSHVSKHDGRKIVFNQTQLIDGVWAFTVDPEEAYGVVSVYIQTKKPFNYVTASHDFGSRILQRKTYEKAGTDIGKAVGKDVAVMRDAAQNLQSKLTTEVGAGMSATRNMTTQLALYMARDLQVIGNTAVSMFEKLTEAGNQTASAFTKDFLLVQRDLVKFTKELSIKVKAQVESAKSNSKALIKNPLALSRDRLQDLKKALSNRKKVKGGSVASPCRHRSLKERMQSYKSNKKALSVVPEPAPPSVTNNAERISLKTQLKKATQQLDTLMKRVKQQGEGAATKMSRMDLRKLKKDVKRQEKLVKKMRAELLAGAAH